MASRLARVAIGLAALIAMISALPAAATPAEVPFGDKISSAVVNYNRTTPFVATAGLLEADAVSELKALGFTAIIDLRTPEEGIAAEETAAKAAGIKYVNIPVATEAPTDEQVSKFAALVEDPANRPLIAHCKSANRAGAMWAMYRISRGIAFEIAIEDGRTVGLKPSRENAIRARLGQPLLAE